MATADSRTHMENIVINYLTYLIENTTEKCSLFINFAGNNIDVDTYWLCTLLG